MSPPDGTTRILLNFMRDALSKFCLGIIVEGDPYPFGIEGTKKKRRGECLSTNLSREPVINVRHSGLQFA